MKRHKLNFLVDLVSLLVFCAVVFTGLLMRYALPPGSGSLSRLEHGGRSGRGVMTFLGLDRHAWGSLHFWICVALLALMLVHIWLHWKWVKGTFRGMFSRESEGEGGDGSRRVMRPLGWALFAATVVALAASFALPFVIEPEQVSSVSTSVSSNAASPEGFEINGRATLGEIERVTGVPAAAIRRELGLPDSVSNDERLGPLRREYGFEIERVREFVQEFNPARE